MIKSDIKELIVAYERDIDKIKYNLYPNNLLAKEWMWVKNAVLLKLNSGTEIRFSRSRTQPSTPKLISIQW